jgi:hypothetical protein
MIKNIFIIGDSAVAYASGGVEVPMPISHLKYGSHSRKKNDYNLFFLWQQSRTAFKVDFDYLENLFKDNISDLGENSVIVSEFGGMDAVLQYYRRYNNMEEVLRHYTSEVIRFCKKYNTKVIFMCPWWKYERDKDYELWEEMVPIFKKISQERSLPEPIQVMYNVVDRLFETVDEWKHHTPEDSERWVDYVILKVEEAYGS